MQRVCRERASKRWSALLTQTKSRIGHRCGMRKRLGEAHWAAFDRYAEADLVRVRIRVRVRDRVGDRVTLRVRGEG